MSIVTFMPAGPPTHMDAGEWPQKIVGNGFIELGLTHNREPLNMGEATYVDQFGECYVITRLRGGTLVGYIRED